MNISKTILIAILAVATAYGEKENEKEVSPQVVIDSEAWTPVESAKKVGSGLIVEWEVPEDGTLFFVESTKRISFVTKSVKKGDIFTTMDDDGEEFDENLSELIEASIPDAEELLPSLRFNLFFIPKQKS